MNRKHILINVNGSLEPLKEALRIAGAEDSWVTVLKVVPPFEGDIDLTGIRDIRAAMYSNRRDAIMSLREAVRREGGRAWVRVEEGDIPETINQVARDEKCDYIYMSSGRDQGFLQGLMGSRLVKKVAAGAPCPVKVIETSGRRESARPGKAAYELLEPGAVNA